MESEKELIKITELSVLIALRKALYALKFYRDENNEDQLFEVLVSPFYNDLLKETTKVMSEELSKKRFASGYSVEQIENRSRELKCISEILSKMDNFSSARHEVKVEIVKNLASPFEISQITIDKLISEHC